MLLAMHRQAQPVAAEVDTNGVRALFFNAQKVVMRVGVQPPDIDAMPWRIGIAGGPRVFARALLFVRKLGKRGRGEQLGSNRFAPRKELGAIAFDEAGVELGAAERARAGHAAQ